MESEMKALVFNLMCDMKKKEIDRFVRARLIKRYMDEENLSIRQLSVQIGIPRNTLQDWLLWSKIEESEYEAYIQNGHTHTDVYQSLREGTLSETLKPHKLVSTEKPVDLALKKAISQLTLFKIKPPCSKNTIYLINELRNILRIIEQQAN